MYISQRSILVLLSILIKDTLCSNSKCDNNNGWPVAEFCKSGQFTGPVLVFDGYGFYEDKEAKEPCSCTAVVSILNDGSSRLVFTKLFSLQPNYNGCGSSITISDSDDTIVQRCFIGGTMPVKDRESISIKLSKDRHPGDTRYCMQMRVEDTTANLTVTCSGGSPEDPQMLTTTSSLLTSTEEVITTKSSTSTHLSSTTDVRTKLSTIYSTLDKYTSTFLPTPSAADETTISISSELKTQSSTLETTQPSTSQSTRPPTSVAPQTITTLLPTIETTTSSTLDTTLSPTLDTTLSPTLDTTSSSTSTLDRTPLSTLGKTTFSLDTKTSSTLQSTRPSTSETTPTPISKITSTVKTFSSTLESTSVLIRDTTPSSTPLSTNPYAQTKTQTSTLSTTTIVTDHVTSEPTTVSLQRETTSDSEPTTESEIFRTTTSTENDKTTKSTSVRPTNTQSTKLVSEITSPQSTRITVTSGQTRDNTIDTSSPSTKGNKTAAEKSSQDKNVPVEVIVPVAVVGGLLIVFMVICISCGIRRKACVCHDELVPSTNKLVHQTSEEIKNREKDTYVNPLYDDISLTGKSDRSDRDSMMQEIPSDEDEDYRIPSSTEIDGELWTHL